MLCQGCICICVQMYFYSDLRHWMELCGCIYISAVARRTHLSYTSDSTFVFFALKHLSPIRQNFRNWSNFSSWFHVSALAKCGLKWSGAKWIQIFITNGSMDGQKMSQKLFSQPQRRSKHVPKALLSDPCTPGPIIGWPRLYVYLSLKPSEDCQCCQCWVDPMGPGIQLDLLLGSSTKVFN